MAFRTNVFINCPFDDQYQPILRAVIFCTIDLGFTPRIALERLDSGETRVAKIVELIEASKYAIHDLSRLKANRAGEFPSEHAFRTRLGYRLPAVQAWKMGQQALPHPRVGALPLPSGPVRLVEL